MDIDKIIKDLRSELEEIQRAIIALERIGGTRRGRPPQWMKAIVKEPAKNQQKKKQSKQRAN
jgi:hypothetical protein